MNAIGDGRKRIHS